MLPLAGVVADQRILAGAAATLRWENVDQDGEPAAATGAVTVGVTRAAGTALLSPGTATSAGDGTGAYTASLTAAQATMDLLTATWTDAGDSSAHTTKIEVVGGFLFSVRQLRDSDESLQSVSKYPATDIIRIRTVVEHEIEAILGFAVVPRYARVTLDGSGSRDLVLPHPYVRSVTAVAVDGSAWSAGQLTGFVVAGRNRDVLRLADGDSWDVGDGQNTVLTYTHGLDQPLPDIRDVALRRARHLLNRGASGLPQTATSTTPQGGVGTFSLAERGKYRTGMPEVDAVLLRYSLEATETGGENAAAGPAAAARQVAYQPQRSSLFHTR